MGHRDRTFSCTRLRILTHEQTPNADPLFHQPVIQATHSAPIQLRTLPSTGQLSQAHTRAPPPQKSITESSDPTSKTHTLINNSPRILPVPNATTSLINLRTELRSRRVFPTSDPKAAVRPGSFVSPSIEFWATSATSATSANLSCHPTMRGVMQGTCRGWGARALTPNRGRGYGYIRRSTRGQPYFRPLGRSQWYTEISFTRRSDASI